MAAVACIFGLVIAAIGSVYFAQRSVPQRISDPATPASVTVVEGHFRTRVTKQITPTFEQTPLGENLLQGVVSFVAPPSSLSEGSAAYRVDGISVLVVRGTQPYERDLVPGSSGTDVAQLKQTLHRLGYLADATGELFDDATAAAIRNWQHALGDTPTGQILAGQLVIVPRFPATIVTDPNLTVGTRLHGGERALNTLSGPTIMFQLPGPLAQRVRTDSRITVRAATVSWPGIITGDGMGPDGTTVFTLSSPNGGPVCGKDCASVSASQNLTLHIDVAPYRTGPLVPLTAIHTTGEGETVVYVVDNGTVTARPITITAKADGTALVQGVTIGQEVLLTPPEESLVTTSAVPTKTR